MDSREAVRRARRATLGGAIAIVATGTCLAGLTTAADGFPSKRSFRAQRLCSSPRPGTASCLGMRLISKSLTSAQLKARAQRQERELLSGVQPAVTSLSLPGGLTPANLHEAYGLPTETAASASQTIGIVDAYDDPTAESDLAFYSSTFGLPACTSANGCFKKINEQGKTSPKPKSNGEWASEISLDVQMAHALCQNCKIVLVEANSAGYADLGAAVNAAAAAGATEISNSYGGAEGSGYSTLNHYYEHSGVVVLVSSGDCGYYNQACSGTAAANFPAASPSVVAVGGTSLSHSGGSWSSTAWSDGGSGCSKQFTAALWQSAASNFSSAGCGSGRSVADVSAVGDPYTGVDVYDTTPTGSGSSTGWGVWGGTSASAPIVAAEFALGGGAHGVSVPATTLYSHLGESADFYDVTSGSNGSCGGATACKAASGLDGPTGVGSPVSTSAFALSGTPAATVAPTVSGTAEVGQKLTAGAATFSPSATSVANGWALCNSSGAGCTAISGASASTYTLTSAAVGDTLRAIETPTGSAGQGTAAWSAATSVVASNVPSITGFSPSTGITGSTITISGGALSSASKVSFGSAAATFTQVSSKAIEAIVPNGASAAAITVTTPSGKATSTAKFTPSLSVVSLSPGRAKAGTTITIKGLGFTSGSTVSFHGVSASSVTFVSSTALKAVVPEGASTGQISVTTEAGTARTAGSFVVAT